MRVSQRCSLMDSNRNLESLPIKVKQHISDPEFRWLKAKSHIVNIVTGSHCEKLFFLFFSFFIETLARPLTPLSISAANSHFFKICRGGAVQLILLLFFNQNPTVWPENLYFVFIQKSDLLQNSSPFSWYSIIIKVPGAPGGASLLLAEVALAAPDTGSPGVGFSCGYISTRMSFLT